MTTQTVLAADIGGTQMRAALVDPKGRILLRQSIPTPAQADVPASLIDLIAAVAASPGHSAPSHAVVGLPGAVDYAAGRLLWAPNLPKQWPGQLSTSGLTAHLGLPVSIANDADLAAVGEATFGAGAGSSAVAYLTISTGIGAGVVHGGRLVRGSALVGRARPCRRRLAGLAGRSAVHGGRSGLGRRSGPTGACRQASAP